MKEIKKYKQNILVLSDQAFLDDKGKANIIGIFEKIFVTELPSVHSKSVLIGNYDVYDSKITEINIKIDIVDDSGKTVGLNLNNLIVKPSEAISALRRIGFIIEIFNLKIEKTGIYTIVVYANDEKIGEFAFGVEFIKKNV